MNNFEIGFASHWPLLLLAAGAVVTVLVLPKKKHAQTKASTVPLALRLLAMLLLALIACGMTFHTNQAPIAMLLAVDRSESMKGEADAVNAALDELILSSSENVLLGVEAFAGQNVMTQDFQRNLRSVEAVYERPAMATDLSLPLQTAAATFPVNVRRRVVLLTDGRTTRGQALSAAGELANKGIRLDMLLFDTAPAEEAEAFSVSLPAEIALGESVQTNITIRSSVETLCRLSLYEEDELLQNANVRLKPGDNYYRFKITVKNAGVRVFRAEIEPQADSWPENNVYYQAVRVIDTNAVLLVDGTGNETEALAYLLRKSGFQVDTVLASKFPKTMAELCRYSLVVLMNVNMRTLPASAASRLRDYVGVYGRSVLTTGGRNSYIYGGIMDTVMEQMLPVNVQIEGDESAEPSALLLMIDNSASMEGQPLTMAKLGAIKCLESLHVNDYAGVLTFSTDVSILSPMDQMMNSRDQIVSDISGLGTIMGTAYTAALQEALKQMNDLPPEVTKKHIILLSDGQSADSGYEWIVREMAKQGITVSTIALGTNISVNQMQLLALLGNGTFYSVTRSENLPSVMLTDANLMQVEYVVEGDYPVFSAQRMFSLSPSLAPLKGYIRTAAKAGAAVGLETKKNHPLYAEWPVSRGVVASFMSDLSDNWSEDWFSSAAGSQVILQMIQRLLPKEHATNAFSAEIENLDGDLGRLVIQSADAQGTLRLSAAYIGPDGEEHEAVLVPSSLQQFSADIPLAGLGKYTLRLFCMDEETGDASAYDLVTVANWPAEYDGFAPRDDDMLRHMCEMTGGAVYEAVQEALSVDLSDQFVDYDPSVFLGAVALICLTVDILMRRLHKNAFRTLRSRRGKAGA